MCLRDCCQNEGDNEQQLERPDELSLLDVFGALRLVHHTAAPEALLQKGPTWRQKRRKNSNTASLQLRL